MTPREERILILAPVGQDAALAAKALARSGMQGEPCGGVEALIAQIHEGCGAVLLAEEVLTPASLLLLINELRAQPPWSDVPLVLLTTRGESTAAGLRVWNTFASSGNVTVLERPLRTSTLVSALQVALRARRRQYQVRNLLDEQEKATRLRDEFISIASHELRTPITALKLQAQLTQRFVNQGEGQVVPDRVQKFLSATQHQIARLSRLVEDMLDVSRINAGKFMIAREDFDLAEVTREVVDRFAPQLTGAGNRIELAAAPCIGRWDRYRVEQVLNNLITNSIRYAPHSTISISLEPGETRASLVFADTGPGIPPEKIGRIFERFERATDGFGVTGLGLGLYICREIVLAHGGDIRVESEIGRGTRFQIDLPRTDVLSQPGGAGVGLSS